MPKRNLVYLAIIILAAVLAVQLNISNARRGPEGSLFDPIVDVFDIVQKNYVSQTDEEKLVGGAINGMLHELDFYSEYIPADEVADFQKQTSGSYEGIGIVIDTKDGLLTVISPIEDSPAYRANILPGDVILEVNDESTKGWSNSRAVHELTGPAGTSVRLRILHPDGAEEPVAITRQEIHVPTVRGWRRTGENGGWDYLLDEAAGIGYVRITQFITDTVDELDRAMARLQEEKVQALILDLRSNPGGVMNSAVEVVDRLIDEGVIVSTRGVHSPERVHKATVGKSYPRCPLVVLIDQGSASASEIVAGALQDHARSVIVGTRSWGKGSVQSTIKLPESGAIVKLTTDYYYLPKGRCVHRLPEAKTWGVEPDVVEELDASRLPRLREVLDELTLKPLSPTRPHDAEEGRAPADEVAAALAVATDPNTAQLTSAQRLARRQAEGLLAVDSQLAQAVKQCKGLLRAQTLPRGIATTLPAAQAAPEPEPAAAP